MAYSAVAKGLFVGTVPEATSYGHACLWRSSFGTCTVESADASGSKRRARATSCLAREFSSSLPQCVTLLAVPTATVTHKLPRMQGCSTVPWRSKSQVATKKKMLRPWRVSSQSLLESPVDTKISRHLSVLISTDKSPGEPLGDSKEAEGSPGMKHKHFPPVVSWHTRQKAPHGQLARDLPCCKGVYRVYQDPAALSHVLACPNLLLEKLPKPAHSTDTNVTKTHGM